MLPVEKAKGLQATRLQYTCSPIYSLAGCHRDKWYVSNICRLWKQMAGGALEQANGLQATCWGCTHSLLAGSRYH